MSQTPWGWPEQNALTINAWMAAYAPWLVVGALVVLAFAANGKGRAR